MARTAYEYALSLLGSRGYTVRNIRRKITEKGFPQAEVDAAMARLETAGLVDDARYAAEYARQKLVHGGVSARRATQALMAKGIAADVARAAVAGVMDEEAVDIQGSIEAAARRKLQTMSGLDPAVQRQRLFAFLMRRGFELSDVQRAVEGLVRGR